MITAHRFDSREAASTAAAQCMADLLKGKTSDQARFLFKSFHDLVTGQPLSSGSEQVLGKLAVFAGVSKFPTRVKCATLGWHALLGALDKVQDALSTE